MGFAMSGTIVDKIKGVLDEFEDCCLDVESDRELIALVIYRELLDDLDRQDERGL
jgi:hypothetical protein